MKTVRKVRLRKALILLGIVLNVTVGIPANPVLSGFQNVQDQQQLNPLTLGQIEDLIRTSTPDTNIATTIQKRGIAFHLDSEILGDLQKLGAGPKTLETLNSKLDSAVEEELCQQNEARIIVLVADFKNIDQKENDTAITEMILEQLREATKNYRDVEIQALNQWITPQQGSDVAIAKAQERKASFVIWGWYKKIRDNVSLNAHFEPVKKTLAFSLRGLQTSQVFTLSEMESFRVQMQLAKEMAYLTLVASGFLRVEIADYDGAIERLTSALNFGTPPEQLIPPGFLYLTRGRAYSLKASVGAAADKALDNAIADFRKTIELESKDPKGYLLLGFAYQQKGDLEKALGAANKMMELQLDKNQQAWALCLMAIVSRLTGADSKAKDYGFRSIQIAESLPQSEEVFLLLSSVYFSLDDPIRAASSLEQAAKLSRCPIMKAYYAFKRGAIYAATRSFDKAIEEFDFSIRLRPDFAYAYWARGSVKAEKEQYQNAIDDFARAISLNQTVPDFYDDRGDAYKSLGQIDKAILDYKEAVSVDPNFAAAHYDLAIAYRDSKQSDLAIESYSKYLKLQPEDYWAHRSRAELYSERGQLDLAIADASEIVRLRPTEPSSYSYRGLLYEDKKDIALAIEDFTSYIRLRASDAWGYHLRAWAYQTAKQFEKAEADYNTIVALSADDANAYLERARFLEDVGKEEAAIEDLKKVLQLAPTSSLKERAELELDSIQLRRNIRRRDAEIKKIESEIKAPPPKP